MTNRLSLSMGLLKTVTGFVCPHLPNIAFSPSQSHFDTPSALGIRLELPLPTSLLDSTAAHHAEYEEEDGRVQYITYSRPTDNGWFGAEFALVRVVFE